MSIYIQEGIQLTGEISATENGKVSIFASLFVSPSLTMNTTAKSRFGMAMTDTLVRFLFIHICYAKTHELPGCITCVYWDDV